MDQLDIRALIVVGGDGMVSLGTNLLAGTKVPLGIVPSGTGNDMARGLGIPHENTEAAIRMLTDLLQGPPRTIDAGRVEYVDDETGRASTRWFAGCLSAGFDAVVNERANRMRYPTGPSRYTIAIGLELLRLTPIPYRLVLDGRPLDGEAVLRFPVAAWRGIPKNAALAVNVTSVEPSADGYVSVWDCAKPQPPTPVQNPRRSEAVASRTVVSSGGEICVMSATPAHMVVDLVGVWVR